MIVLFMVLAAVCFVISATRKAGQVPWSDLGMILLTVALIFAFSGVAVDLD